MQTNTNLLSAYREISDTYRDISQSDYISKLMKSEQEIEAQRRASAQEISASQNYISSPKKSDTKPDEPAQKPTVQHKSRSRRG